MNSVHYSAKTVEWPTPQTFFDHVDAEFGFQIDVCSTHENAKCTRHFTVEDDALIQRWAPGPAWMNPPYGRGIEVWVRKAYESALFLGTTVVCLLPARTDTRWWHDYVMKGEVRLIKGRLVFGVDAPANAPFPNALVVFGPDVVPSVKSLDLPPSIRGRR